MQVFTKKSCVLLLASIISVPVQMFAQGTALDEKRKEFDKFRQKTQEQYDDFRARANKQYADFMRQAWEAYELMAPLEKPKDESVPPQVYEGEEEDDEITYDVATTEDEETNAVNYLTLAMYAPKPKPQPIPFAPIHEMPWPEQKKVKFEYYGTVCEVRFDDSQRLTIPKLTNDVLADMWLKMSGREYNNTIRDCLGLRDALKLNDWGYFRMLHDFANAVYGETNEAALLIGYLYSQSGYRMRLVKQGEKLSLLYASEQTIYAKKRLPIDGLWYYSMDDSFSGIHYCNVGFPQEQSLELDLRSPMEIRHDYSDKRVLQAKRYPDMKIEVAIDRNLLKFYEDYPVFSVGDNSMTRWTSYANAPIDERVKEQIYPALQESIKGLTKRQAVNKLLNFMQTAFDYEYDEKVWGYDRAFFGEETLYYPFCDCEDRAILFTRLVRDLVGLPAVLIHFPGHLAAAVAFDDVRPSEAAVMVKGTKYTIADPTFIGASAGRTSPTMPVSKATAIILDNEI